jgi:hypothetical protein
MLKRIFILLISISFLYSCETWRSECGGEIVVVNSIPDTTLYLNGESFRRDLFEYPVVLKQTEDKYISFYGTSSEPTLVSAKGAVDDETGDITILEVTPQRVGTSTVTIMASDNCSDPGPYSPFEVTVIDSTQ